jgi:hypothetical protein
MNWQQPISLLIVAVTAVLLARSFLRKKQSKPFGFCDSDCGCSATDLLKKLPPDKLRELRDQRRQHTSDE